MDGGNMGTTAGIDPKVLDNCQQDAAFALNSWEQSGYNQPPEWDTSQDSSDAGLVDLGAFIGPFGNNPSLLGGSDGRQTLKKNQETKFGLPDGAVEGTISSTVSPRTLPSSTDDNFHPDESWPRFQLFNSPAVAMSMDDPLFYPYAKGPTPLNNTVIVDDTGDIPTDAGLRDPQSDQFTPFKNGPPVFPFAPPLTAATMNSMVDQQLGVKEAQRFTAYQNPMSIFDLHTPNGLASDMTPSAPFLPIPQEIDFQGDNQTGQDGIQYKSESSSVSGDFPSVYEFPYSRVSDDQGFADTSLNEGNSQYGERRGVSDEDASSDTSLSLGTTTAFMVSEDPSVSPTNSLPSRAKAPSSGSHRTSTRPPALSLQTMATVRKRKQRTSAASSDQGSVKPLQIVQEDGQGGSIASADFISPPRGARRKGPLTTAARANAGMRRKNKDTCVQCRLNKRKCDGSSPCDACRPTLHEQPCARACFASIVEYGTCNYISQRAINHPTRDGYGRVRMSIPSEFDLNDLLSFLSERQGRFNIRARQSWGSLYVLDLGETYRFMKGLSEYNGNSRSSFLDFIDRRLVESKDRSKNWLTCVKDCDPMNNVYSLLSQWNNMPSRASYSFVPLDPGNQERPMDVNNPGDRRDILLAAQLSRIFCRMLEVEGFRKLERDFYNIKWKQISQDTHLRFLKELGHILLTLRWRVSWWKRLGDGGQEPDPTQQHYVDRVDLLCRILYVYYTSVLGKLPSWTSTDIPKGVWSHYADSENPIWDDFPLDPTDGGFQRWMERGRELIEQAGVRGRSTKS